MIQPSPIGEQYSEMSSSKLPTPSHIRSLQVIKPDQLRIIFRDEETYNISLAILITNVAQFSPLKDGVMFDTAQVVDVGSVVRWACGAELSSEYLYRLAKRQAGEPTPKNFRLLIGSAIFLVAWAYLWCPIEPKVPGADEVYEIAGMPKYVNTSSTTNSSEDLKVNDMFLHCRLGSLGGSDGCQMFKHLVDAKKPARATYFFQPTRLGYHYKVLNSLEQDGQTIVSPEYLHAVYMRDYRSGLGLYYVFTTIFFIGVCIILLITLFDEKIEDAMYFLIRIKKSSDK